MVVVIVGMEEEMEERMGGDGGESGRPRREAQLRWAAAICLLEKEGKENERERRWSTLYI